MAETVSTTALIGCPIYVYITICISIVAATTIAAIKSKNKFMRTTFVALFALGLIAAMPVAGTYLSGGGTYKFGVHPDKEQFYLVVSVDKDGTVEYLNPDTFEIEKTSFDLSKAQIGKNIPLIGIDNTLRKAIQLPGIEVYWDTVESNLILSKYDAIQLGMLEPTGADDEKQFKIATSSEAIEELQNEINNRQ